MSKKKSAEKAEVVEAFTQFEIGEMVIPVVASYDDLPWSTILKLNEMSSDFVESQQEREATGERLRSALFIREAIEYVTTYAAAIGQSIDFDRIEQKGKALSDVALAYPRLFLHFNGVGKPADETAEGEGKNE